MAGWDDDDLDDLIHHTAELKVDGKKEDDEGSVAKTGWSEDDITIDKQVGHEPGFKAGWDLDLVSPVKTEEEHASVEENTVDDINEEKPPVSGWDDDLDLDLPISVPVQEHHEEKPLEPTIVPLSFAPSVTNAGWDNELDLETGNTNNEPLVDVEARTNQEQPIAKELEPVGEGSVDSDGSKREQAAMIPPVDSMGWEDGPELVEVDIKVPVKPLMSQNQPAQDPIETTEANKDSVTSVTVVQPGLSENAGWDDDLDLDNLNFPVSVEHALEEVSIEASHGSGPDLEGDGIEIKSELPLTVERDEEDLSETNAVQIEPSSSDSIASAPEVAQAVLPRIVNEEVSIINIPLSPPAKSITDEAGRIDDIEPIRLPRALNITLDDDESKSSDYPPPADGWDDDNMDLEIDTDNADGAHVTFSSPVAVIENSPVYMMASDSHPSDSSFIDRVLDHGQRLDPITETSDTSINTLSSSTRPDVTSTAIGTTESMLRTSVVETGWLDDDLDLPQGGSAPKTSIVTTGWLDDDLDLPQLQDVPDSSYLVTADDFGDFVFSPQQSSPNDEETVHHLDDDGSDLVPIVSPTEWFSGLIKNIGDKTSAGLDKLYGALDQPGQGTRLPPTGPLGQVFEPEEKFRGLLDKVVDTPATVKQVDPEPDKFRKIFDEVASPILSDSPDGKESMEPEKFKSLFDKVASPIMSSPAAPEGDDKFRSLFDTRPEMDLIKSTFKSTMSLASKTKDKLKPAVTGLASKVKQKITEMPKQKLRLEDLQKKSDIKQLLFAETDSLEYLEVIQVTACKASINLKRLARESGLVPVQLFREDPSADLNPAFRLNCNVGWDQLEAQCEIAFPDSLKTDIIRILLLASNSTEFILESFCNLEAAPETIDPFLFQSLLRYTYTRLIADFTRLALCLLSLLVESTSISDPETVEVITKCLIYELCEIKRQSMQVHEDVTLSFPELQQKDCEEAVRAVGHQLDIGQMASILREVYYVMEPIVALNNAIA